MDFPRIPEGEKIKDVPGIIEELRRGKTLDISMNSRRGKNQGLNRMERERGKIVTTFWVLCL